MRNLRYVIGRSMIHMGLRILPEGRFKTDLMKALWDFGDRVCSEARKQA